MTILDNECNYVLNAGNCSLFFNIFLNVATFWSQPNIKQPPAARDLWLAQRASPYSWTAPGRLRTLAGPNGPARWLS